MKRMLKRSRSRRGFTLIEMIIASLLLVIGVTAALGAMGASTRTASYAAEIQTAALLAQKQLAETASQPSTLSSGGDQEGSFDDPYSAYHWRQSVEATDYPNLFKVTMTVTWGPSFHTSQREIVTYLRSDQSTITQQIQTNYTSYQNNQTTTSSTTPGGASGP
jgi:type II secretion system protein I